MLASWTTKFFSSSLFIAPFTQCLTLSFTANKGVEKCSSNDSSSSNGQVTRWFRDLIESRRPASLSAVYLPNRYIAKLLFPKQIPGGTMAHKARTLDIYIWKKTKNTQRNNKFEIARGVIDLSSIALYRRISKEQKADIGEKKKSATFCQGRCNMRKNISFVR